MADPWDGTVTVESNWPPDLESPVDVNELETGNPLKKVRFQFRHQDEYILERIQSEADDQFTYLFTEAIEQMNGFYSSLRVPRQRNGIPLRNEKGEFLWETDKSGNYIEDWNQLNGQELEQLYMNLERIKVFLAPQVNKLKLQAMWAQIAAGDAKDDVRVKIGSGTESDKTAQTNKGSREDRYLQFFKFYLYSTAQTFFDQIVDFIWKIKDVRNWRIQSQV